jgi:hypothetical protein
VDRDDAFNKLVECVEKVGSGSFENVEQAFVVAAQALNYIMDDIDGSSNKESD